ncbi:MAG: protease SohB [Candidatus Dasytiphilus stammeri]
MRFILYYGLFLAKIVTSVVITIIMLIVIKKIIHRKKSLHTGYLALTNLGDHYRDIKKEMLFVSMSSNEDNQWQKENENKSKKIFSLFNRWKKQKLHKKIKPIIYVIDFNGSFDAKEVSSLREEISAVLLVAKKTDQVLLRLESSGGLVHSYGLAASQLQRLRNKGIFLNVIVDKIAASGGYMMATVANHIIAAPFAIIGSIGVVAQFPNFHRLLKRNEIDFELHTAGEHKRTLTLFGENSEQARQKFRDELDVTHQLFKSFVHDMRPTLDIDRVATGEHWFGTQALKKGLIDAIGTSDDFILHKMNKYDLIALHYRYRGKGWINNLLQSKIYKIIEKLIWQFI